MGIYDVPINELIICAAEKLKSIPEISPPEWAEFVKTGMHKERPPVQKNWWFIRTASILLKIHRLGPIGVSKLRVKYGGKKNRGVKPEHFYKGSGNILRKILQQLEKAELAKQQEKGVYKGRVITSKGISLLDKVSIDIMKQRNIVIPKKPEEELKISLPKKKKKKKKKTKRKKPIKRRKTVRKKKTEEKPERKIIELKPEQIPKKEKPVEVKEE